MKHLNIVLVFAILFILGSCIYVHAQTQSIINTITFVDNSNNEDGFKVERSINKSTFVQIATPAPNIVQFSETFPSDVGNTEYCYRVRAYNTVGDSGYSNTACKTTATIIVIPNSPNGLVLIIK